MLCLLQYSFILLILFFDFIFYEFSLLSNFNFDSFWIEYHSEKKGKNIKGMDQLGYRVLTRTIREIHDQKVPSNLVYAMMGHVDPTSLKEPGGTRKPVE